MPPAAAEEISVAKLGSFGAAMRELDPDGEMDTIEFFGEEFTVEGVVPSLLCLKVSAGLAGELNGVESDAVLYETLRYALTKPAAEPDGKPDRSQWERFYALALDRKEHADDLVALVLSIIGAQVGKDLAPLPTSANGSPSGSPSSSSSATGTESPEDPDSAG